MPVCDGCKTRIQGELNERMDREHGEQQQRAAA
jgi:hypothetical protein